MIIELTTREGNTICIEQNAIKMIEAASEFVASRANVEADPFVHFTRLYTMAGTTEVQDSFEDVKKLMSCGQILTNKKD